MEVGYTLIYRGPLDTCNYNCIYCPFTKNKPHEETLKLDLQSLERFVNWIENKKENIFSILFTPWGEALTYPWYKDAIHHLSKLSNIKKVVIQTNLSAQLEWLVDVVKSKVALWCTYHPLNVEQGDFLSKTEELYSIGIRHSIGIVGLKEFIGDAEKIRERLNKETYFWVNAYKRESNYYSKTDLTRLLKIDPYFYINYQSHESIGHSCQCGKSVFSINGNGDITRCHFVKDKLGNIYTSNIEDTVKCDLCPNNKCQCYIGYIHLDHLSLNKIYGNRKLERIPNEYP